MLQVTSDDRLAVRGRSRRARRAVGAPSLEVQLALQLLVAIEVLQRVGRADFERDERVAVRRLAELAEAARGRSAAATSFM